MKRTSNLILLGMILLLVVSCGSDENIMNGGGNEEPVRDLRINEVFFSASGDQIEIKNFGTEAVNVANYRFCSRFTYPTIGNLTIENGSLTIQPGGILAISGFNIDGNSADLGLYRPVNSNADFADADFMLDFVQWGASGIGRETVAVSKGIWTAGQFVQAVAEGRSIEYDGEGDSPGDWFERTNPTIGAENGILNRPAQIDVRINEVFFSANGDQIELKNFGTEAVDVSEYRFCSLFTYPTVGNLTVVSGSFNIQSGGLLVVSGFDVNENSADLGLYRRVNSNADFADADFMLDFVQWGGNGNGRETVASGKGIWTAAAFVQSVADGHSLEYDGDGDAVGDWSDQANPTLGAENQTASGSNSGSGSY